MCISSSAPASIGGCYVLSGGIAQVYASPYWRNVVPQNVLPASNTVTPVSGAVTPGGTPAQRRYPSVDWPGLALGIPCLAPPCHRAIRAGIAGLHPCRKRSVPGSAGLGLTSGFAGWPLRWGRPTHCARCRGVSAGAGLLQGPGGGVIGMAMGGMATVVRRSCVLCRREGFVYEGGEGGASPGGGCG